jgi:integrase/recombinase XerD
MNHNMNDFTDYLIQQGLSTRTRTEHLKNIQYFNRWCEGKGIEDNAFLNRSSILAFVEYMAIQSLAISTQNIRLNSIKKYYDYLKKNNSIQRNPAQNIVIRNATRKVVHHPLSEQALKNLFDEYCTYLDTKPHQKHVPSSTLVNLKRKVIASLVIFQGLHTGELKHLLISDINLENSTVTIAGGARSNSRILSLHQAQIIPCYEFLLALNETSHGESLFEASVQTGFHRILSELKGINPLVQNLKHIRASVLMNWIKQYGKRKAQYMIGHRYVSTTQSYEIQDTSELSELMERTHLFG